MKVRIKNLHKISSYEFPLKIYCTSYATAGEMVVLYFLDYYAIWHSPQDQKEAEAFLKNYNEIRNSPLVKALS